jgi:hypothetical protein
MPRISKRTIMGITRLLVACAIILTGLYQAQQLRNEKSGTVVIQQKAINDSPAAVALTQLEIKGRAPKTGYSRALFSSGWGDIENCDVRNYILARDLIDITLVPKTCKVATGTLIDPYTAQTLLFVRGIDTSDDIQIDHVVALSDAWQKGAQLLAPQDRYAFANDPLNLLAVQGVANQVKGDGDAATWLPASKTYRCAYIARLIAVKTKYELWVTSAEYQAMQNVLETCPNQLLPL